jgi:hypothetical protein
MLDALVFIDRSIVTVLVFNQFLGALADFGVGRRLRLRTILLEEFRASLHELLGYRLGI